MWYTNSSFLSLFDFDKNSLSKARAEEFARKYNIAHVADDYRRFLDRKDIDAVRRRTECWAGSVIP